MTYHIISTILFALLCFVWKKSDWFNLFFKLTFLAMAGWGGFLIFSNLGFIVKI